MGIRQAEEAAGWQEKAAGWQEKAADREKWKEIAIRKEQQ